MIGTLLLDHTAKNKKALLIGQKSFQYDGRYCKLDSDLSVPIQRDGIGTLFRYSRQVVKASSGHYPQPFLIRGLKNCCKDKLMADV